MKKFSIIAILIAGVLFAGCGEEAKESSAVPSLEKSAPNQTSIFASLSNQVNQYACKDSKIKNAYPVVDGYRSVIDYPGVWVVCENHTTEFWEYDRPH